MDHPRPLFNLFSSFQTNITIFTSYICEKCPSSIQCLDSNPQPSEHESPPITTRPGLPSFQLQLFISLQQRTANITQLWTWIEVNWMIKQMHIFYSSQVVSDVHCWSELFQVYLLTDTYLDAIYLDYNLSFATLGAFGQQGKHIYKNM